MHCHLLNKMLILFGAGCMVPATLAETLQVPGDHPTIQQAIDNAANGDLIQVAAGTYHEHGLAFDDESPLVTIQGTRAKNGALLTTIDAQSQGSVFQFMGNVGSSTVIKDLVITGGSGTTFQDSNYGGGIFCFASGPTITGCTITGNLASWGGGIHFDTYSFLTLTDCTISDNIAGFSGGGIYSVESFITLDSCTISNNIAGSSGGGFATSEVFPGQTTMNRSLVCANQPDQVDADQLDLTRICIGESCDFMDGDGDGLLDCHDGCPDDPLKDEPGACGCGLPDIDTDADTILDCDDAFPNDPDEWSDSDGDGLGDNADSAPRGPCCVNTGCVFTNETQCAALGGTWLGEDADCKDCPPGCPGDLNGDGIVDAADLGLVLAAWGAFIP